MSIHKDIYSFKDKTWYIVPWKNIDPDITAIHPMPSLLIHDVNGPNRHRVSLWNYYHLTDEDAGECFDCGCRPSKKIQTLWILENMDNPEFNDETS